MGGERVGLAGWTLLTWLLVACAPGPEDAATSTEPTTSGTPSGTTLGTTTDAADGSSASAPEPPPDEPIDVMDFSRCDGSERDPLCIATDETCICGPGCFEYGPAGAPGRCPLGPFVALCPGGEDTPYVCVIPCTVDGDCPDPQMVCRACPPAFEYACLHLGSFYEQAGFNAGPLMCTWPKA